MVLLAIETSCDETCAAVLKDNRVLASVVSSQTELHQKWGGVVPNLAKRAHEKRIEAVIFEALKRAAKFQFLNSNFQTGTIDRLIEGIKLIAVTQGPGLAVALGVGIDKAKELAKNYKKKLVAVNHIEGHLMANWLKNSQGKPKRRIRFPVLALTVSGGHSQIIWMKDFGDYKIVGETLDDAAGEALDKAAKMLGLGYPGGPIIERLAVGGDKKFLDLPRPMKGKKGFDYSFSGLKTSFYYTIKKWSKERIGQHLADLAACFQAAVFDSLVSRYQKAIEKYQPASLVAAGGVSANMELRRQLRKMAKNEGLPIWFPVKKEWCTDNAAMIGLAAFYKAKRGEFVKDIDSLDRQARLKLSAKEEGEF